MTNQAIKVTIKLNKDYYMHGLNYISAYDKNCNKKCTISPWKQ